MKKYISTILAVALVAFTGLIGSPAMADERPNYTVTEQGVQLPDGYKFEAHGHVNVKWQDASGKTFSGGMHFDPNNNQPGGYYIGKSFFDFTSVIKEWDSCPQVTWVQVHGWNYHYTAEYDPNKCPTPPGDNDSTTDDNSDHDSDALDDDNADTQKDADSDGSKDGDDNPSGTEDGNDDSSKDNTDDDATEDDESDKSKDSDASKDSDSSKDSDAAKDTDGTKDSEGKDAEGGKDGGEIPPTGANVTVSILAALALVGGGVMMLISSRRNRE